jgi:hypothetical protein
MVDRVTYLSTATQYRVMDAIYDLALKLPNIRFEGVTDTHPLSTTFTDPYLPNVNGLFLNGTVYFWWTTDDKVKHTRSKLVTDHVGTTITFTPEEPTMATGTGYSIFDGSFPHWILIQSLGMALRDFGDIPVTRTITTVENQEEYDYTDSAEIFTGNQLISVEIAQQTSEPYDYYKHMNWSLKRNAANGETLCFDAGHVPDGGYNMRLTYWCKHLDILGHEAAVSPTWAAQDGLEIAPALNPERLSWAAAVYALRWRAPLSSDTPKYKDALQEAIQRAEQYRLKYPIDRPVTVHLSKWQVGR